MTAITYRCALHFDQPIRRFPSQHTPPLSHVGHCVELNGTGPTTSTIVIRIEPYHQRSDVETISSVDHDKCGRCRACVQFLVR